MEEKPLSQTEAQSRATQIQAFQNELAALTKAGVVSISPTQNSAITDYHQSLFKSLTQLYNVDVTNTTKQLTLGMKIASLIGAIAMALSIFFLFVQFWGHINTTAQVVILITAPLSTFLLSIYLAEKEKGAYFAKIAALISLSCFVLNLSMFGQIFNISPSPNAFLVWASYAFLLAYACNARLLLFFAITSLSSYIAMQVGSLSGMYWISFGERPEHFFIPSLALFFLPQIVNHKHYYGFDALYRIMAMIMMFLPILILSNWGKISYLPWSTAFIEGSYQILGFVLSAAAIWLGIKKHWREVVNTGNVFFILFLYTKFFDWWWQWLPKYLFFFILGLSAILALMVFKRLRLSKVSEGAA